jgi:hypothetical protein
LGGGVEFNMFTCQPTQFPCSVSTRWQPHPHLLVSHQSWPWHAAAHQPVRWPRVPAVVVRRPALVTPEWSRVVCVCVRDTCLPSYKHLFVPDLLKGKVAFVTGAWSGMSGRGGVGWGRAAMNHTALPYDVSTTPFHGRTRSHPPPPRAKRLGTMSMSRAVHVEL